MSTRPDARRAWVADLAWGALAVVLACIGAAIALQLWNADLHVPFSYHGDALQNQLIVKGVLDHGWYQSNPDLGAPFGLKLFDFPVVSGDNLQILIIKLIGVFTSDSAVAVNVFFLIGFPLAAASAFACLRLLGISRPSAVAGAVLFALLPYHFVHGETHLFISAYYAVPLGAYLALRALSGKPLPFRDRTKLVLLVLACVVIGSAYVYYAAFTIALLVVAGVVRLAAGPRRTILAAALPAALIAIVVVANHAPNIIYQHEHGKNSSTQRAAADSEQYGLKIAQMVLPVEHHRVASLARLRARYDADGTQVQEGDPQALGIVATVGFVGLLVVALLRLAIPSFRGRNALVFSLAALTLAAVLLGTLGGFSSVFAYVVTAQVRAWGRIAIFIAFFSLAAVVVAADRFARGRSRGVVLAGLAGLLLIGWLDQTNAASAPDYAAAQAAYRSDGALVSAIEARLPAGARVFELPYEPFPEPQPQWIPAAGPYDLARGYIHSHHLRWSYGLMKGRAGNWEAAAVQLPPALLARALVAAGFSGVYLDRTGYADGGSHVLSLLLEETHGQTLTSPDGRLVFVDLRPYGRRLRARFGAGRLRSLRAATLQPFGGSYAKGFSGVQQDLQGRSYRAQSPAQISLVNYGAQPRRLRFVARLEPAYPQAARLEATFPDGSRVRLRLPASGRTLQHTFTIPPGSSAIVLRMQGHAQLSYPDGPQQYDLRLVDPLIVDRAFDPFGPVPAQRQAAAWLAPFGAI